MENNNSNGPVFEAGPGWGKKIGTWFKKYFYSIIVPVIILALIIYGIFSRNNSPVSETLTISPTLVENLTSILTTVIKGDGNMTIARRVLSDFLSQYPEDLTPAQKIYAETVLGNTLTDQNKVGDTVTFSLDDIRTAITSSNDLTDSQIKKWTEYAKKAGVK